MQSTSVYNRSKKVFKDCKLSLFYCVKDMNQILSREYILNGEEEKRSTPSLWSDAASQLWKIEQKKDK